MAKLNSTKNRFRTLICKFTASESGAIAVIVVLALGAIMGTAALAIDLSRVWNLDTELQNAADAAALACASQLDRDPGARARGQLAATGTLVQNTQTFASDGLGSNVVIQNNDIVFYSTLTPKTVATTDADADYCEVNISPRTVNFAFAAAIGAINSASPSATAIAELFTAHCTVPPIFICNPNEPGGFDPAALVGVGVTLKDSSGGGLAPGNFGLLGLDPLLPGASGLNDIRDAWARVNPMTDCSGRIVQTQPGQLTALAQGLNMRFDIRPQGVHQVPAGEPPTAINPQYTPAMNNVKGMLRSGAQCSIHPQGWGNATQPFTGNNPPAPTEMGFPRETCAYNSGTCDTDDGGTAMGNGMWDSASYMTVNHGVPDTSGVPDLDGDGQIIRYEVYQDELTPPIANLPTGEPEVAPVCHFASWQPPVDRRVIVAAVLNCAGLAGISTTEPIAWVELFLTEPMGVFNGNNDLYSEIIGPGATAGGGITRYILQLVE